MSEGYRLDRPLALSCPECGGVTREEATGELQQFRCHIGHVLTAEAMLAAQFSQIEWHLGASLALLNERAELCRRMAEHARQHGNGTAGLESAEKQSLDRAERLRTLLEEEWVQPARRGEHEEN